MYVYIYILLYHCMHHNRGYGTIQHRVPYLYQNRICRLQTAPSENTHTYIQTNSSDKYNTMLSLCHLTPFLTTLTAGVITEVKKMGEHSHALMPPSESTRHKLLPSTIYLHRYIIACLIFHCLWYLVVYLCQPQHIDSHSYQNRICMLQTAPSVIYNAMFSLYLDPLPNYS